MGLVGGISESGYYTLDWLLDDSQSPTSSNFVTNCFCLLYGTPCKCLAKVSITCLQNSSEASVQYPSTTEQSSLLSGITLPSQFLWDSLHVAQEGSHATPPHLTSQRMPTGPCSSSLAPFGHFIPTGTDKDYGVSEVCHIFGWYWNLWAIKAIRLFSYWPPWKDFWSILSNETELSGGEGVPSVFRSMGCEPQFCSRDLGQVV